MRLSRKQREKHTFYGNQVVHLAPIAPACFYPLAPDTPDTIVSMRRRNNLPEDAEVNQAQTNNNSDNPPITTDTVTAVQKPRRGRPPRKPAEQNAEVNSAGTQAAPAPKQPKLPRRTRANAASTSSNNPSAPRRRRQKPVEPATAAITIQLIEAVLKGRSTTGATALDLEQVVAWASGIRSESQAIEAETANIRKLGPRTKANGTAATTTARQQVPRQEKLQALDQRRQRNELDRTLLEGILAGTMALDVVNGGLVFRYV